MKTHAVEEKLLELEHQYWQAMKDKDVDAAMRLTDDPCIVTGAQGVGRIDARTLASMMKAAPYTLHDFEVTDAQVHLLRDDVAVVAYRVHEDLTVEGEPVELDAADASTWVRRNGHWVCALHTEALAGEPFGRDRRPSPANVEGATASTASTASTGSKDEHDIRKLVEDWLDAARHGDVDALLGMMTDDAVFMVPGEPPFGRQEFAESARELRNVRMDAAATVEEVVVLGEWAFCRVHLTVTTTPPDGTPTRQAGPALSILRKQPDGSWAIARDANLMVAGR